MFLVRFSGVALVAAALVLAAACGDDGGSESGPATGVTSVVIDGDGAIDDIKAMLYLLERPDVEVLAVTMSGTGVGHCPEAAENASAVLERIDAPDIPVACGRSTPLAGDNEAPPEWRAAADTLGGVELPDPRPPADQDAAELLAETISAADEPVVLVALGPLTNVAEAVEADPSFLDHVEMIYLMGGAVDVGGNVLDANPAAEFNIWADPLAASIVFAADVPITLVPLDATNVVPVTPYLHDAVAAHRDASPVAGFMADHLDATPLLGGLYQWDELAAVIATDESVATFEDRNLAVVAEGGPTAGAIVEDVDGRPVRVAVDADRHAFEDHFYEAIIGTPDPDVPDWEPDATVTWDGRRCDYDGPDPLPERLMMQIDNTGAELVGLVTGTVAPGTSAEDVEAFAPSPGGAPPDWWTEQEVIGVPPGGRDVWPVTGGPEIVALCYVDPARFSQVAGPRPSG